MKEGWTYKKLPDISENLDSIRKPVTKSNRITGIYPYYGASGIVDYVDDYLFDENLLCISEDGANLLMRTYPIAFPISGKVWVNNHAHVLRFKNMATQKYVEYFFAGTKIDEFVTGAAQPKLTQKALNSISIKIPTSIEEQQRIVSRLDSAFAHIDELKANAEKQLSEARTLFQKALTKAMEPKEGWEERKIREISLIKGGKRVPQGYKLETEKTDYPYIRVADFTDEGTIDLSDIHYINNSVYQQIKNYTITDKDIYISIAGTIGKSGIIPSCLNGANLTENACKLVLNGGIEQRYVYWFTKSDEFKGQISLATRQTSQPKLALTRLAEVCISLPPLSEQKRIVSRLDSLSAHVRELEDVLQKTIAECDALKQAMLRKVFE